MRDPHVEFLRYKVRHHEGVEYKRAGRFEHDAEGFQILVEDGAATFFMKEHYPTEEIARMAVAPFIEEWSISVALEDNNRPHEFDLDFESAHVIDRDPPKPGEATVIELDVAKFSITGQPVNLLIGKASYPAPPAVFKVSTALRVMYHRYEGQLNGREPLPAFAYYVLTEVERLFVAQRNKPRHAAAQALNVDRAVLGMLGNLSSKKGGTIARKAEGRDKELTPNERAWILAAVRSLMRRIGEYESTDHYQGRPLTLAELPTLP